MMGDSELLVVVGSGGVGKTTLAAALGLVSARAGHDTLVMTFDPSLRLKDALKVGEGAREGEVEVPVDAPGSLNASLLDARATFDRLIERYAPDEQARRRILENRFYHHLSGSLAGILEYMAVERLFEIAREGRYSQVILDTPPTRQALDFLEAPSRIVDFLDSKALTVAQREWFDDEGRLKATSGWGPLGRQVDRFLDKVIGVDFLRDVSEFFLSFGPLYEGFRQRAEKVQGLLLAETTRFLLVAGPGEERIPDALFFARKLAETGHHLESVVVNRVHPRFEAGALPQSGEEDEAEDGLKLLSWLGEQDHKGLQQLRELLSDQPLVALPMTTDEPTDLPSLEALGAELLRRLDEV